MLFSRRSHIAANPKPFSILLGFSLTPFALADVEFRGRNSDDTAMQTSTMLHCNLLDLYMGVLNLSVRIVQWH